LPVAAKKSRSGNEQLQPPVFDDGITQRRKDRITKVVLRRQLDVVVVLENVHDPHNIGAVLRSCDSVGVVEVFIIYTEPQLTEETLSKGLASKSASGAKKWIRTRLFSSVESCANALKSLKLTVLATHLGEDAKSIYKVDLTGPVALVFGNEHDGISDELMAFVDGNIFIPQMGLVKSLNISVACAVSLYELFRQRDTSDMYVNKVMDEKKERLLTEYLDSHNT